MVVHFPNVPGTFIRFPEKLAKQIATVCVAQSWWHWERQWARNDASAFSSERARVAPLPCAAGQFRLSPRQVGRLRHTLAGRGQRRSAVVKPGGHGRPAAAIRRRGIASVAPGAEKVGAVAPAAAAITATTGGERRAHEQQPQPERALEHDSHSLSRILATRPPCRARSSCRAPARVGVARLRGQLAILLTGSVVRVRADSARGERQRCSLSVTQICAAIRGRPNGSTRKKTGRWLTVQNDPVCGMWAGRRITAGGSGKWDHAGRPTAPRAGGMAGRPSAWHGVTGNSPPWPGPPWPASVYYRTASGTGTHSSDGTRIRARP